MKKPNEIKLGLEFCSQDASVVPNGRCPYGRNCEECDGDGIQTLKADALAYILQLEERVDLMLIQMQGDCGVCKRRESKDEICAKCLSDHKRPMWEYEGLPEVKKR